MSNVIIAIGLVLFLFAWGKFRKPGVRLFTLAPVWRAGRYLTSPGPTIWWIGTLLIFGGIVYRSIELQQTNNTQQQTHEPKWLTTETKDPNPESEISQQSSLQNLRLFKSYVYGSPISDFTKALGYYDCSEHFGSAAMCIDNVDFLGHRFTAALGFNRARLESVTLTTEFDQDIYVQAMITLMKTFTPCIIQGTNDILDLIQLAKTTSSKSTYASIVSSFEIRHLNQGQITYIFLEISNKEIRTKRNALEAVLSASRTTRLAELSVAESEDGAGVLIAFTLPHVMLTKVKQMIKTPAEQF